MPHIEWNESFSVNNAGLDDQHKQWINIHNELHNRLVDSEEKTGADSMASDALHSMLYYARYHFAFEEEYMDKIGYAESTAHKRVHKDFDSKIYQYCRDMHDGKMVLSTWLMKELKNWLLNHILIEDQKYCRFAAERETVT